MRIFYDQATWGGKVNFVDEKNVLVGYDMSSSCCEYFGWFIRESIDMTLGNSPEDDEDAKSVDERNEELKDHYFDTSFFDQGGDGNETSFAVFKLIKRKNDANPLYLHLFNCHNGYYSHGFSMINEKTNEVIQRDSL